jgi:hypothetical protein
MKSLITFTSPELVLESAEREMALIPNDRLFNDAQHQKLRERWCAGIFGVGYAKFVAPCTVAVNDIPVREDIDIFLTAKGREWGFQLAEVQEPGRKRGLEYKEFAQEKIRSIPYGPERGWQEGPEWLADGVRKKKEKLYSDSKSMHLLLYANFPARELEHSDLLMKLQPFRADFASLWIVTSMHLCSIFSSPELGEVGGWGIIRSMEHYYQ